jgi:NAD(P)-dependent dehydrogenase (short-subunit alcohol dehydrogenase family)
MDLGIADHVAIVTGGGAGIGAHTCVAFAKEGVHLAVVDIDAGNAQKMAEEVKSHGVRAIALEVDVSKAEATRAMVEKTLGEFGKIDILANLAGVARPGLFQNSKEEHWEQEIDACLYGVMNCCKAVIEPMMERSYGKIVNVASDAGKAGEKIMVSYSAAKAGIMGFTRSLAREMGRYWINVNAVCPGMTKGTGMTAIMTDELEKRFVKNYALRRLGRPEDTTALITFLASKPADWITGQAISVNGGYYMGG